LLFKNYLGVLLSFSHIDAQQNAINTLKSKKIIHPRTRGLTGSQPFHLQLNHKFTLRMKNIKPLTHG